MGRRAHQPPRALVALLLAFVMAVVAGCGAASPPPVEDEPEEPPHLAVALRMVEASDEGQDTPQTGIRLVVIAEEGSREVSDVGIFPGACSHAPAEAPILLRITCWWGGTSAVVTLTRDGDRLIVRRALSPEDVEVVETVDLPHDAVVQPIRPEEGYPVE